MFLHNIKWINDYQIWGFLVNQLHQDEVTYLVDNKYFIPQYILEEIFIGIMDFGEKKRNENNGSFAKEQDIKKDEIFKDFNSEEVRGRLRAILNFSQRKKSPLKAHSIGRCENFGSNKYLMLVPQFSQLSMNENPLNKIEKKEFALALNCGNNFTLLDSFELISFNKVNNSSAEDRASFALTVNSCTI